MEKINKIIFAICKPNPKVYTDPDDYEQRFDRNKTFFWVHWGLLFSATLCLPITNFTFEFDLWRFICMFSLLFIFMICCRSYMLLGHIANTIVLNCIELHLATLPDAAYFHLSIAYFIPLMVFFMTQNVPLVAISGCNQFVVIMGLYKKTFERVLMDSDLEQFADNFVRGSVVPLMVVIALYVLVLLMLNKTTRELSKATKAAEEALDQQKTFVYSFSHEMRNPMNSLLGNIDLALMADLPLEIREMLSTAKVCGVLLLNLINTVLDAAKLGIGKLEISQSPTRVHDTFQRIWSITHDLMRQKGLKSYMRIEKTVPPKMLLDGHRINQVCINLIGNAIKFTETGSISITVQWLKQPCVNDECFDPIPYDDTDEGLVEKEENIFLYQSKNRSIQDLPDYFALTQSIREFNLQGVTQLRQNETGVLKIMIRDTGCGISREELCKLFQKFSQVGSDDSKKQMGTGLGLYISKEICRNLNGDVRVYSKPQLGTTFVFCIPSTALATESKSQSSIQLDSIISLMKHKKFNTLIADDSPFNVNLVSSFSSKLGLKVLATASNGLTAYQKYVEMIKLNQQVNIVTLDIDMPIMDGKQACEKIRDYEREHNLKPALIILISGNYEEQHVNNFLDGYSGRKADCFLKKPLLYEEFCWTIYKHITL